MRISDWSSDVCSSDLFLTNVMLGSTVGDVLFEDSPAAAARAMANRAVVSSGLATMSTATEWMPTIKAAVFGYRKSAEWAKCVSVRVDLGGRRHLKKTKTFI